MGWAPSVKKTGGYRNGKKMDDEFAAEVSDLRERVRHLTREQGHWRGNEERSGYSSTHYVVVGATGYSSPWTESQAQEEPAESLGCVGIRGVHFLHPERWPRAIVGDWCFSGHRNGGAGAPTGVQLGSGVGAGEGGEGTPERGVDLHDELVGLVPLDEAPEEEGLVRRLDLNRGWEEPRGLSLFDGRNIRDGDDRLWGERRGEAEVTVADVESALPGQGILEVARKLVHHLVIDVEVALQPIVLVAWGDDGGGGPGGEDRGHGRGAAAVHGDSRPAGALVGNAVVLNDGEAVYCVEFSDFALLAPR